MKNYIIKHVLTLFLGVLCFNASLAQSSPTYTVLKSLNTRNIDGAFYESPYEPLTNRNHGILVVSSNASWNGKVELSMYPEVIFAVASRGYIDNPCTGSNTPFNDLLLYRATAEGSSETELQSVGEEKEYIYKGWYDYYCKRDKRSTSGYTYFSKMSKFANDHVNGTGFFVNRHFQVRIELKLPSEVKLSDIKKVVVPGVGTLYPKDFIKQQEYRIDHGCHITRTGVCAKLDAVRSIPSLSAIDVKVQAHRGVWGKPDTNQENTIGAITAAGTKYLMVESDIMPIGVTNYTDPTNASTFGVPADLACFHDFVLTRYTNASSGYIFNSTRAHLKTLSLKKPRSEEVGNEKIMFFDELVDYAVANNLIVCVDMKNLESHGQDTSCTQLCDWQTQERKNMSLYNNLKFAINNTDSDDLKHLAIKTYANYEDIKAALTTGTNPVSEDKFNKVLWAPLIAKNDQWKVAGSEAYDPKKIQKFLDDWFAHNESVLYYETNFFNDYDNQTSVMLTGEFSFTDSNGSTVTSGNVMEYIYDMTGRRAGIFSEEPVGGKGTVNRWSSWNIKDPGTDRRGDHLWLLQQPFFKHAVITTDRPDIWNQLND
ncbi:hypothetical protein [Flavivirga jejuensis]|uniref:Uncharacterized protein n=1 Tax=Flavivirga jejuensis TaxID=870487 RepID=A0ABT8WK28_9FLAO|nr:hypothetical protein [Flavivirga jejuensis]MDO5973515.1 hypothetical protein [Flavivirga jejuensis]